MICLASISSYYIAVKESPVVINGCLWELTQKAYVHIIQFLNYYSYTMN